LEKLTGNANISPIFLILKILIICSCEIIRDKVSGDSLQYSFIEFAEQKSCEDAYFKMDNVLIDDRRIHVDFSQSVSKLKWKGKGKYMIKKI
jgi:peptidyl-prolyl cis-trans isomerase-like 4